MKQTATQFQMFNARNAINTNSRRLLETEPWAAFYCRLSQDDGLDGESNSIQHQKQILERYAKEHGIIKYEFYVDDGISGTTFNRPGFQEMLSDIEAGLINMVVVKDMSRFGRDYLQVGMYTEVLFPERDIHFVAINDNVDSEKGDNDFTPLRNLFNEWYARDTSKKIRAVVKTKGMSGKRLSHLPPYGYVKDDDGNWAIDDETGSVVKEIFAMCLSGLGPTKIANILTARNIPTPGTVNYRRYGNLQGYCPQAPCKWLYQSVSNILERKEYLGHTVNFKTTKKSYKSKKVIVNGDDKRMTFENTHPALIDQDTFDRVQIIREGRCRHTKMGTVGLFSGLLFCADCGSKMYHHRGSGIKESYEYYTCAGYSKRVNPCTTHHISIKNLKVLVATNLKRVMHFTTEHEREFITMLASCSMREQKRVLAEMQKALDTSQSRYDELDNIIQHLYEDKIKGNLTDDRFSKLSAGYEAEQKGLEATIRELTEQLAQKTDKTINIDRFIKLVKQTTSFEELTPTLLNTFIEKILVHDVEVTADGQKRQKIEIVYNFIGSVELPEEAVAADSVTIELPQPKGNKRKKSA
jgi:site-specific DNA recombinase